MQIDEYVLMEKSIFIERVLFKGKNCKAVKVEPPKSTYMQIHVKSRF